MEPPRIALERAGRVVGQLEGEHSLSSFTAPNDDARGFQALGKQGFKYSLRMLCERIGVSIHQASHH